jgi:hypothetical protein
VVGAAAANGAHELAALAGAETQPRAGETAPTVVDAARIRTPATAAVALGIAVALTLLMALFASPLDTYVQAAASALFH